MIFCLHFTFKALKIKVALIYQVSFKLFVLFYHSNWPVLNTCQKVQKMKLLSGVFRSIFCRLILFPDGWRVFTTNNLILKHLWFLVINFRRVAPIDLFKLIIVSRFSNLKFAKSVQKVLIFYFNHNMIVGGRWDPKHSECLGKHSLELFFISICLEQGYYEMAQVHDFIIPFKNHKQISQPI